MKSTKKREIKRKRRYAKPRLERVKVDKQITMVMMTDPPIDPPNEASFGQNHFLNNPFKLQNF